MIIKEKKHIIELASLIVDSLNSGPYYNLSKLKKEILTFALEINKDESLNYQIRQTLELQEIKRTERPDEEPRSYIRFNMVIEGYSSNVKLDIREEINDGINSSPIAYNPLLPLVKEYIPPNRDGLLEVESAVLQGLTTDRAFIADSKGNLNVLEIGDKVYLGYLAEINTAKNQVVFILNKGGFFEKVILNLKEQQTNR